MYSKTKQLLKGLFAVLFVLAISFTSCNNEGEKAETKDSVTTEAPAVTTPQVQDSSKVDSNKDDSMDEGGVKPVVPTQPK
jgi:hypothetical protein